MKLTIDPSSTNYACQVIKLPPKQKVEGLDNLVKVTHQGNDVLTKKDADENRIYIFFPAESCISAQYLSHNNEYRESTLNRDRSQTGYFEPSGRVKSIKFKGVISTGYIAPLETLHIMGMKEVDLTRLKIGDEFTHIDGVEICKKYRIVRENIASSKDSRYNKKLKRFDKLVQNQFRFHQDTSQLAKNLHLFHSEDIIVITDKWHGTSAVFANLLINKELTWYEKLAKKLGLDIVTTKYDNLYSSRSVIKNQYINKEATLGFYNEDVWKIVDDEIKDKIEPGISLYGEIVGYLPSGKHIQRGYDYGCMYEEHKFVIYRITYTKPDGNVIEFSWQQIKNYCNKYSLEHVKELYFGSMFQYLHHISDNIERTVEEVFFKILVEDYLEKDCEYCVNKVPAEGICVRRDGLESYSTYKLKSKRFLERETKELDKGEINIEDEI